MSLNMEQTAKKPRKDFGRVEDGLYPARIVRIIDLGLQVETDWKTKEVKTYDDGNPIIRPKVWIDFELPTETIEIDGEDRPRWYGKDYTVSNYEKAAIQGLVKATKCGADLTAALGKAVMVQIASTQSGKAKVAGVMPVMKGMDVPPLDNPTVLYDIDNHDEAVFQKLPEFLRKKILENEGGAPQKSDVEPTMDDDIPF